MKLLIGALIIGILPIWRDPNWTGGVSVYEAIYNLATKPQKEHIGVEEAVELCRQAYLQSQ